MTNTNTLLRNIGTTIRQLRLGKGWSRLELAGKLSISGQCIAKWESGDTNFNAITLNRIADLLEIPIARLFDLPQPEDEAPFKEAEIVKPPAATGRGYVRRTKHVIEPVAKMPDHSACNPNEPESLCEECRETFEEARVGAA